MRILSICSERSAALSHIKVLRKSLIDRGHSRSKVSKEINRAISRYDRGLSSNRSIGPDRINFVITYHPALPDINKILREEHHLLHLNPKLKLAIPSPPRLAFRRPKNLRNFLCRGRLPSSDLTNSSNGCGPCSLRKAGLSRRGPSCAICPSLTQSEFITSTSTGRRHRIITRGTKADCDSKLTVYCLTCEKCNLQYVGRAVNFRLRINNHKSSMRKQRTDDFGCRLLYTHFNSADHSWSDISVTILQVCANEAELNESETQWIWRLNSLSPRGLNVNDGFGIQTTRPRRK